MYMLWVRYRYIYNKLYMGRGRAGRKEGEEAGYVLKLCCGK